MFDPGMIISGTTGGFASSKIKSALLGNENTAFLGLDRINDILSAGKTIISSYNPNTTSNRLGFNFRTVVDVLNPKIQMVDAINRGDYALNNQIISAWRAELGNIAKNALIETVDKVIPELKNSKDRITSV